MLISYYYTALIVWIYRFGKKYNILSIRAVLVRMSTVKTILKTIATNNKVRDLLQQIIS